ncbi:MULTISPECIES: hypothetical protein [Streptomyces]|uniref:hypothetical protein n=1 Tax=Streptomyces TaxID=1883 RepID=UPI00140B949C|nr:MULTISPECIES: hypothetical protein [Streptomyces]MDH6226467.1 hypothetical protein [Streptomyces sp. MJP52]
MATNPGRLHGRPVRRYVGLGLGIGVSAVLLTRFGPLPVSSAARLWEQLAARAVAVDPQRLLPHHSPPGQAAATYRATTVWCRERAGRAGTLARRASRAARRPRRTGA